MLREEGTSRESQVIRTQCSGTKKSIILYGFVTGRRCLGGVLFGKPFISQKKFRRKEEFSQRRGIL